MTSKIIVKFDVPMIHRYEDAPAEVDFLRECHRHKFFIEVRMSVSHNDRELEFFMVQAKLAQITFDLINENTSSGYRMSCEMMAEYIIKELQKLYGEDRYYECSVLEDGENGAIVCTE